MRATSCEPSPTPTPSAGRCTTTARRRAACGACSARSTPVCRPRRRPPPPSPTRPRRRPRRGEAPTPPFHAGSTTWEAVQPARNARGAAVPPELSAVPRVLITEEIAERGLARLRGAGCEVDVRLDLSPGDL